MSCPPCNLHINCQNVTRGENQTRHSYDTARGITKRQTNGKDMKGICEKGGKEIKILKG